MNSTNILEVTKCDNLQIVPQTINESHLYSLILPSKTEEAKLFIKLVTIDVLPSIRKHGEYLSLIHIWNKQFVQC